jgi:hypothetical protein
MQQQSPIKKNYKVKSIKGISKKPFYRDYVSQSLPLVFLGMCEEWDIKQKSEG